jgi:biotin carboxyl carrier protein
MSRAGRNLSHTAGDELYWIIEHTVRPLVQLAEQAEIEELRVHHGALQVVIRRDHIPGAPATGTEQPHLPASTAHPGALATPPAAPAVHHIRAGVVGFFHVVRPQGQGRGAAPPAVAVGQRVRTGQVVGYIEAMSVVSEVESDADGEVVAILAQEGQPVEYGQPLIELRVDALDAQEPGTGGQAGAA